VELATVLTLLFRQEKLRKAQVGDLSYAAGKLSGLVPVYAADKLSGLVPVDC
jgi:hypothetical protein